MSWMKFPIDKHLNRIFNETSDKFEKDGISRQQIKDAFYLYFRNAADMMGTEKTPVINIPKFGWLKPRLPKLRSVIEGRKKKGKDTSELEESLERLKKEFKKIKRNKNK